MGIVDKNNPPLESEVNSFLSKIDFQLPGGFIDFYKEANGADISTDDKFVALWALTDMVQLNKEYNVEEYAPDFFIFGSDGGDMAFAIEKNTGDIYEMPFIGMSKEGATYISKTFTGFIEDL